MVPIKILSPGKVMKSIEVLALGVRLVGIISIFEILQFFAYSYRSIQQWMYQNPGESIIVWLVLYGLIGFFLIVVCFCLIKFPLSFSRWLLPKADNGEAIFNGSIDDLKIAAFTVMGVYILSWAVPDFIYNASMLFHIKNEGMMSPYNTSARNEYIIQELITVLEVGIGLYLCLQAKGLNNLLLKFRGLSPK